MPPPNDLLANAIELSGESVTVFGNSVGAGTEPGEYLGPFADGHSIWYKWEAPRDMSVMLDTGADFYTDTFLTFPDTSITVYTGPSVGPTIANITRISTNDDFTGHWFGGSRLRFRAEQGTTYYIQITDDNGSGDIELRLERGDPFKENEWDFGAALNDSASEGVGSYDTLGAGGCSDGTYMYCYDVRDDDETLPPVFARYDPTVDEWTELSLIPGPYPGRAQSTQMVHVDGKLYLIAGSKFDSSGDWLATYETWIYDIQSDSWSQGASIPQRSETEAAEPEGGSGTGATVEYHAAAASGNDIYVLSGFDPTSGIPDFEPYGYFHVYHTDTDSWNGPQPAQPLLGGLPWAKNFPRGNTAPDGTVHFWGDAFGWYAADGLYPGQNWGDDHFRYDPQSNTWTDMSQTMVNAATDFDGVDDMILAIVAPVTTPDGMIWLMARENFQRDLDTHPNDQNMVMVAIYDPESDTFTPGPRMPLITTNGAEITTGFEGMCGDGQYLVLGNSQMTLVYNFGSQRHGWGVLI